jgi:site-specific DNA-methyltransferase (adenine-specific)
MDALILRDNAKQQLAQIKDIETGVEYLNKVKAIETWAKAEKKDAELQNIIAEQKLRTQRILGNLLKKSNIYKGAATQSKDTTALKLSDIGVTRDQSSTFQKIASLPQELFEEEIATAKKESSKRIELTTSRMLQAAKQYSLEEKKEQNKNYYKNDIKNNKPTVYHKDCIEYLNNINDNSIDLLLTDPPYSTDVDNIKNFAGKWVNLALSKIKTTGRAFICIGAYPKEINAYLNILLNQNKFIVDNPLIWTYKNTLGVTPKMKYNLNYQIILHLYSKKSKILDTSITNEMFSVQEINAPDGRLGDRFHTWQKPNELALRLIKHTTKESDIVIDPFTCTGTFLLMAAKMNRKAEGCDISKENLQIAKERGCTIVGM